jgi:uncharacterized membrane protein YdbT with pleckstrin-like domain
MIRLNYYYRLRKRARALRLVSALIKGAVVFGCCAGTLYFFKGPAVLFHVVFWLMVCGVALAVVRTYRFSYAFGEKSVIVRCGALLSGHDIIPYHHIRSVYATRAIIGRLFGLCELHIYVPRAEGLRTQGDSGEYTLLCARRGSDEIVFPVTIEDAREIVLLIKKRMRQSW